MLYWKKIVAIPISSPTILEIFNGVPDAPVIDEIMYSGNEPTVPDIIQILLY